MPTMNEIIADDEQYAVYIGTHRNRFGAMERLLNDVRAFPRLAADSLPARMEQAMEREAKVDRRLAEREPGTSDGTPPVRPAEDDDAEMHGERWDGLA